MAVFTTGLVRFSYAHVFEPNSMEEDGPLKYSVSIIVPKSDVELLNKLIAAVDAAFQEGITTKFGGKEPRDWKYPLHDGDIEKADDPAYADSWYFTASTFNKPGVCDRYLRPLTEAEFYSGCYGRASISFYAYNNKSRGVACGLSNIQKLYEGPKLGASTTCEQDFDVVPDDDAQGPGSEFQY